jgi:hypothetical protein
MTVTSKKSIFTMLLASVMMLMSCDKENINYGEAEGYLSLELDVNNSTQRVGTRASESAPSASEFAVTIYKKGSTEAYASFESLAKMGDNVALTVGSYTVKASYGKLYNEGFGLPYYEGNSDFTINDGKETAVTMECTLANSMVRLNYTDNFKKYFTEYTGEVQSSGNSAVKFSSTETRAGYFKPGILTVNVNVKKQSGAQSKLFVKEINALARHEYVLTLDVDAGTGLMTVEFDDAVSTDSRKIYVTDEALNASAPTLTANGFTNNTEIELREGRTPSTDLYAYIKAEGGIDHCYLYTNCSSLTSDKTGWPATVDLCNMTAEQKTLLTNLGLKTLGLTGNKGNIAQVDFTNVIKNIEYDSSVPTSTFRLRVVDNNSKENEDEFALKVATVENKFTVVNRRIVVAEGSNQVPIQVTYDGDVQSDVEAYYLSIYGQWTKTSFSLTSDGENHTMTITLPYTITEDRDDIIKLTCGNKVYTVTAAITNPLFAISAKTGDVWTEDATVTLSYLGTDGKTIEDFLSGKNLSIQVQEDGATGWTTVKSARSGKDVTLSGLTPGTTYVLRAKATNGSSTDLTGTVEITTETKRQLPNASFESWYSVKRHSGNWYEYYPWDTNDESTRGWDTMNKYTFQTDGSYRYNSNSGTISTTDSKSGYAALIRTVGWGNSNTAGGSASVCQNKTPGELYLGSFNSTSMAPDYGMSFTSRPKTVTFYYMYAPTNNDSMTANVVVENRSNGVTTVLAQGSYSDSNKVSSYTQKTITLVYTNTELKATHLRIEFKSGSDSWSDTRKADSSRWAKYPSFGNLSDGEFYASQLYIDDVTLGY